MNKLFFVSIFTLGVLSSFIFGIVLLILMYAVNVDNILLAMGITIVFNIIFWLIAPKISDFFNGVFYKVKFLTKEEVFSKYPEVAELIEKVSTDYNFNFPKIGIIPDNNPTAFTYGSARYNARIVLTEGIFHFLNVEEVKAVVAHELGHIVHRDFMVMTAASLILQLLYEVYIIFRPKQDENSGATIAIGFLSYAFYIIGSYVLYYLSRTREYSADAFSATLVPPDNLSNALIKIAYGIVTTEDTSATTRLLNGTGNLGIIDVKDSKSIGVTSYITNSDPKELAKVIAFDKINPWVKILELSSTHPLTGKRISFLGNIAKANNQSFTIDIDAATKNINVDKTKVNLNFLLDLFMYTLPLTLPILSILFLPNGLFLSVPAVALGLLINIFYKFPTGEPKETTILDEMKNPYASSFRGKLISLSGEVVGKGTPGYVFGEDMMYKDKTGMIFIDYSSLFGFIGNIIFGMKKVDTLINTESKVVGWFYRGTSSILSLKNITANGNVLKSYPRINSVGGIILITFLAFLVYLFTLLFV